MEAKWIDLSLNKDKITLAQIHEYHRRVDATMPTLSREFDEEYVEAKGNQSIIHSSRWMYIRTKVIPVEEFGNLVKQLK